MRTSLERVGVMVLAAVLAASAVPPAVPAQTLGKLDFPVSGAPAAQPRFLAGVGYLHNFEYDSAAAAFRDAQRLDPGMVMAYWGEAMTYNHPVWNQKDVAAARAVLARLGATRAERVARAPTPRERGYLEAVETLYGDGPKPQLDTLYADAMARLSAAHPDDDEARAFHALALLGLSQGVRDVPTYMRAGAIAMDVLRRNDQHPGALHYAIHAFDDPTHAPLGLRAAQAYSRVAPDAPHAQHMTTHIFLALGMWDETISQNVIAAGPQRSRWTPGHYTYWLLYGQLQAGRHDEARDLLGLTAANAGPRHAGYLALMQAAYLIDTERWTDPVALAAASASAASATLSSAGRAALAFARGYAALQRGDRPAYEAAHQALAAAAADSSAGQQQVLLLLLRGAEAQAGGRLDEGIDLVRRAAEREEALPVEFGPPAIVKPSYELLGEMLLAAGRDDEAIAAFRRALQLAPGRRLAERGLAAAGS